MLLAHKTKSSLALFSQIENGRSWPFQEERTQSKLPDAVCLFISWPIYFFADKLWMDIVGPTLERTAQLISIERRNPFSSICSVFKLNKKPPLTTSTHLGTRLENNLVPPMLLSLMQQRRELVSTGPQPEPRIESSRSMTWFAVTQELIARRGSCVIVGRRGEIPFGAR